ncbi:Uncharacterised protein [Mycobacteroides abscessus subsp. abscessus]|uniref:Uncharacterized protein n=2 Tax=Dermabacter vaginalis TaxID=1630135 RepID=A0ABX6A269_9MICO|nr:hypothetical protein FOB48_02370 [Dermabacter vaginalis]SHW95826.1 Uncharacterised protein [Mycobacteroides abscessus subsp. abscessus]
MMSEAEFKHRRGLLMGFFADAGAPRLNAIDGQYPMIEMLVVSMHEEGRKTTRERRDYILRGFDSEFDYMLEHDEWETDGFPEAVEWFRSDAALK